MAVVCDTAVLIPADRRDRRVAALARVAADSGTELRVPAACVGQAWRDGARQVALARFLRGCREVPLDSAGARAAGELLAATGGSDVVDASLVAATGGSDVVDASLVAAARAGDVILTGDEGDLRSLVQASGSAGVQVERFG